MLKDMVTTDVQLAKRHGLDYGKLFHNHEGGYTMEKLKKCLERQVDERDNGLEMHPFLDVKEAQRLDDKLRKVLRDGMQKKGKGKGVGSGGVGSGFGAAAESVSGENAAAKAESSASGSGSGSDSDKPKPLNSW